MTKKDKKIKSPKGSEEVNPAQITQLQDQLDTLTKERDEFFEKLQRVSADYVNFQKRIPKQVADSVAYEKERIIRSLLPALDNFGHMLEKAHAAENAKVLVEGVQMIYDQMMDIMNSHGVERIQTEDARFDPNLHEAMMQRSEPDKEENIILEEFQRGYTLGQRVIRPSKVIVNKYASTETISAEDAETSDKEEETQETQSNQ